MSPLDTLPEDEWMDKPEGLREQLRLRMEADGLGLRDAASRIGNMSSATLSQWLNDKYQGDNARVETKVRQFLNAAKERAAKAAIGLDDPDWQPTPTGLQIEAALQQAQHFPDLVVFAGAPGTGKTVTAHAYRQRNPNVYYAMMSPDTTSPNTMMREFAQAMDLKVGNPAQLRPAMGERLLDTGALIIVDEAQHLNKSALDMARSLFDRYGVGIAFLGNHGFFAGTLSSNGRDSFAQFFSRVGARLRVDRPNEGDVKMMLDAYGVADAQDRKLLVSISLKQWGLRGLQRTVRQARMLAHGREEPVGLDHYRTAWARLSSGGAAE
ncbi:MAG: AAA family ATPase [Pseudomonadota bacterium]